MEGTSHIGSPLSLDEALQFDLPDPVFDPQVTVLQGRVAELEQQLRAHEEQQAQTLTQLGQLMSLSTQQSAATIGKIQSQLEHLATLLEGLQKQSTELSSRIVKLETLTRESLPPPQRSSAEEES